MLAAGLFIKRQCGLSMVCAHGRAWASLQSGGWVLGVSTWHLHALNHEWHFQCALSVEAVTSSLAHGGETRLLSLNKESAEVTLQGG